MDAVGFIKQFPVHSFTKGETIMSEGDILEKLLAIRRGYVKVTALDESDVERMLWIASRYDIVPTEQLFTPRSPLLFFYTALTSGEAYTIPKNEFLAYAKDNLSLMTDIATSMSTHYDDLLSRINSIGQPNVHEKLTTTLQYLAARFSANTTVNLHELGLTLTHQDLAEMIGSTRETTSIELQRLKKSGHIDYDRSRFVIYLDKFPTVS